MKLLVRESSMGSASTEELILIQNVSYIYLDGSNLDLAMGQFIIIIDRTFGLEKSSSWGYLFPRSKSKRW